MSYNVRVNESPNHFMVLDAISRGANTVDKISRVTKLHKSEVEIIVNDLASQRLIAFTEKRGFFGNKKKQAGITEIGLKLLNSKKQELEEKMQEVQQWYGNGNRQQLQQYMESNRAWIPMMLFSGIMNMMFFMSMMSFMGMAMNPAESALAGDTAASDAGAESGAQDAGSESGGTDAGVDSAGVDLGDMSF